MLYKSEKEAIQKGKRIPNDYFFIEKFTTFSAEGRYNFSLVVTRNTYLKVTNINHGTGERAKWIVERI